MKKLLIPLIFLAATAHAQYCAGYAKQYDATIQAGAIAGTLTNYTMLVSGTYPYLAGTGSGGFSRSPDGYDITFNQAGTPLIRNMPIYVSATGQIKANVLIPSASAGTVISMCVGKGGMTAPTGSAYDPATVMALQFPSAGFTADSTGHQTLTPVASPTHVSTGPTYLIDALSLDGTSQYLDIGVPSAFPAGNSPRTVSFWANLVNASNQMYVCWGDGGDTNTNFAAWGWGALKVWMPNGSSLDSLSPMTIGAWARYDIVYNSGIISYYKNGMPDGTAGLTPNTISTMGTVGRAVTPGSFVKGQMAEVRVAGTYRSHEWVAAEYLNQSNPAAFYSIAAASDAGGVPPVVSAVSIVANSPLSVKATWTTDVASNSQVSCGTVSGGPYMYASNVVNPNVNGWNVTAHSMASNPMPNGTIYCVVTSIGGSGGAGYSEEVGPIVLPAMPFSVPIAMVTPTVQLKSKLGDRYGGLNGAPHTGAWSNLDNGYFCWADDNNEYMGSSVSWGNPDGSVPVWGGEHGAGGFVKFTDSLHTHGTLQAAGWQTGINNMVFRAADFEMGGTCISIHGNLYNAIGGPFGSPLMKSADYFTSTINPPHNVGPDTTYITNMTCTGAGAVTATSKLNITDELPIITLPGKVAMYVAGATGTAVNGIFGDKVTATATTISWINPGGTCAGWSWSPAGGTGNGGGTITVYNWDVVSVPVGGPVLPSWVQNDGPGYENGTPWAGMDSFVYWFAPGSNPAIGLERMRVEDFVLQDISKAQWYIGKQIGDDGIYESSWESTWVVTPTNMNPVQFALRDDGKGANQPQMQYLTALHRYVIPFQISGITDSSSGGTAIYDAGLYPWSALTLIGSAERNVDVYFRMGSGPEFPQFVAKSQTSANGVTSINLEHNGGNFGGTYGNPSNNEYDMYMNQDLQFVAAPPVKVAKPLLAPGEVVAGLDLAYNFDVLTGSLSMPNAAPADANQKWAWQNSDFRYRNPIWIDQYGSILHSAPTTSSSGGSYPSNLIQNIGFQTPYAEALPGPLTVIDCFGHYPTTLLAKPAAGAIALMKGTDLTITWAAASPGAVTIAGGGVITAIAVKGGGSGYTAPPTITIVGDFRTTSTATAVGVLANGVLTSITVIYGGSGYAGDGTSVYISEPTNNWKVSFLGTTVGNVSIPDNSIGCVVVRRDSSNRVSLYTSAGIGKSLPLTAFATATVTGPWTTSPLVIGDGGVWGVLNFTVGNSFWGVESLLRVWSRDIADDELIAEMGVLRDVMWARGKGGALPAPIAVVSAPPPPTGNLNLAVAGTTTTQAILSYTHPLLMDHLK